MSARTSPARTIAIGDIHGCGTALRTLLDTLEVTEEDTIVILGDIVARGPDTEGVIEQLLALRSRCRQFIFVRGNHEEMLLSAFEDGPLTPMWMMHGGRDVLTSYDVDHVNQMPAEHLDFIRSSVNYWEDDTHIFVHANLDFRHPLDEQHPQYLRWERYTGSEPVYPSGKTVVVGHTVMPHGMPQSHAGWVAIDTGAFTGNKLTAFDTTNHIFYQADERGNRYPTFPFNP